jgi:hypothetical protein
MPWAFPSFSHGEIAFGFFNIDTDMLLKHYCLFSFRSFLELIRYVRRGGCPQWKKDIRPAYVPALQNALPGSRSPLFNAIDLEKPGRF